MKTPRQILFDHHAPADAELERIQARVLDRRLRGENEAANAAGKWNAIRLLFSPAVWLEVFRPARQIWAGFALVWVAIIAVNLSMEPLRVSEAESNSGSANALLASHKEQQRILAELIEPPNRPIAERSRSSAPKPQSRRKTIMFIG